MFLEGPISSQLNVPYTVSMKDFGYRSIEARRIIRLNSIRKEEEALPSYSGKAKRLIECVIRHADRVSQAAKDPFGQTPLFANAVEADSGKPARVDTDHVRQGTVLSNPASQFHWLRLLAGLTELGGAPDYVEAAQSVIRHMFRFHTDKSGLIYWGGHTAYDLERQHVVFAGDKAQVHELKCHYPDYALMWETDSAATNRYVEAMWNAHMIDWSILDFNRHGPYDTPRGPVWQQAYKGGSVFFWGKGLTFANAGSDLYYAAAMLTRLSGKREPLLWSKRLAARYVETRQGDIGISGYQYSQSAGSWCDGPSIRGDRAQYQLAPLIPEGHLVYESTLFKPRPSIQRCQLELGEKLGSDGSDFIQWSCDEAAAWGKTAYHREDNGFIPMLTDGWSIEGLTLDRKGYFGPKGRTFGLIQANPDFFWMYAMAYRLSGDPFLWQMARDIVSGLGLGDIGSPDGKRAVRLKTGVNIQAADYRLVYGMLELYLATGTEDYLKYALWVGELLLRQSYRDGWFSSGNLVLANNPIPLALLHLAAAVKDKKLSSRPFK